MPRGAANVVESRRETMKLMRMRAFCFLALMGFGTAAVLSQGAAVPISQEHHHHLIIENSYVKAYEVEVPPHESTLLHRHDFDYVYVVFGDAEITNAVEGKPVVSAHLADSTVNFVKGPFLHIAGNVGDTPFRNITISLLHRQRDVHIFYPTVTAALEANARKPNQHDGTILLETDDVRVVAAILPPTYFKFGTGISPARLMIFPDRINDASSPREKNAPTFPSGLLKWLTVGESPTALSYSPKGMRIIWLEFKEHIR
jgi:hypothetical protein